MKKIYKFLITIGIVLLAGFLIGYLNTLFTYEFIWANFQKGMSIYPFYIHILFMLLAIFFAILFHELGHFITFKKLGIDVKAMYVLCFGIVKINGKWKLKFIPKFLLLLGGIVIPDKIQIRNEAKEEEIIDKFKKVLIAGPNTSIIYGSTILIMFLGFFFTPFYALNGFLFSFNLLTLLMTILAVLSSKVSNGGIYGDYAAINAFNNDQMFRMVYLLQLVTLIERDEESLEYLWKKVIHLLSMHSQYRNRLYLNLVAHYMQEITFEQKIGCVTIENKLKNLENKFGNSEDSFMLYHFYIYYNQALGNFDKVEELLNKIPEKNFKVDKKVAEYYERLTNHLLKKKDESAYLNDPKNNYSSSVNWLYAPLELKNHLDDIK
ncbi:M50 family metallopeptidase [Acholeplasma equirhinis]|uniref:M50 family metallopeptidase n=1 Tax=Acholeplasma equirhinis TaxID=555393 RepID=UPI00197AAD17|nr:M50 family metallopeptidase [Acholeplasma equirhinis]MBN3490721.1 M50 family metallopeptidase [Acholeplasma equirhinis]